MIFKVICAISHCRANSCASGSRDSAAKASVARRCHGRPSSRLSHGCRRSDRCGPLPQLLICRTSAKGSLFSPSALSMLQNLVNVRVCLLGKINSHSVRVSGSYRVEYEFGPYVLAGRHVNSRLSPCRRTQANPAVNAGAITAQSYHCASGGKPAPKVGTSHCAQSEAHSAAVAESSGGSAETYP